MTGKLSKNFHRVGIGPLSKILAVKRLGQKSPYKNFVGFLEDLKTPKGHFEIN